MSLLSHLTAPRSEYLLEVSETSTAKIRKSVRFRGIRRLSFKMVTAALIMLLGGGGVASGFLTYTAAAPAARADWVSDIVCSPLKVTFGAYDGASTMMESTLAGNLGLAGISELFGLTGKNAQVNPDTNKEPITAYEKYTPLLPNFESWTGVYDGSSSVGLAGVASIQFGATDQTFQGTGGNAKLTDPFAKGTSTSIPSAKVQVSPMFSHNFFGCVDATKAFGTGFANGVFLMAKMYTMVAAQIFSWGQEFDIASPAGGPQTPLEAITAQIDKLITAPGGLKDSLYLPFLVPMIMIGAITLFWVGIVRRSSLAAGQAALWMVFAACAGLLFVSKPMLIPNAMNYVVTNVTQAITTAVSADNSGTDICSLHSNANAILPGTTEKVYIREARCSIWYASIYAPWVSGQYGVGINSASPYLTNDPRGILSSHSVTLGKTVIKKPTWPLYQLDNQAYGKANNISEVAYAQLSGVTGPGVNAATYYPNGVWSGSNLLGPIFIAFMSLFVAIVSEIFVLVSGVLLLGYQFATIFLILMSPFFFLIGAAPGWGRRIAMRWVEEIVAIVVKRIVLALILALFLKMYAIIIGITTIPFIFQEALIVVLAFVALFQRKRITQLFTESIRFGGDRRFLTGETGRKAGHATKSVVGTAAAVGLTVGVGAVTGGIGAVAIGAGSAAAAGLKASNDKSLAKSRANAVNGQGAGGVPGAATGSGASGAETEMPGASTAVLDSISGSAGAAAANPTGPAASAVAAGTGTVAGPAPVPVAVRGAGATRPAPAVATPGAPASTNVLDGIGSKLAKPDSRVPLPNRQRTSDSVDLAQINRDVRRKAITKGVLNGLQQGLASGGRITPSLIFAAGFEGLRIGDMMHDNAVDEMKMQGQTVRAEEQSERDIFGLQMQEEQNRIQEQRNALETQRAQLESDRAAQDRANADMLDNMRRTINRVDRRTRPAADAPKPAAKPTTPRPRPTGGATGGNGGARRSGSTPRFPRQD